MFRKFTLSLILTVSVFLIGKLTHAAIIDDYGSSTTYNLGASDSLTIVSGTYTGTIGSFPTGAKITITGAATFLPNNFPNAGGKMYVYGTAIFNMAVNTTSGFTLNNYGVVSFNSTVDINISGSNQVWTNNFGALINFVGDATIRSNNILTNYGLVTCGGDFIMRGTAQFTNYKNFAVTGTFEVLGGTLENWGKINTTGLLNFNNGTAVIHNYCGMSSLGGIRNTSINFYNHGYLWSRNDLGNGDILNTGTITNTRVSYSVSIIHGKSLINTGTITGHSVLYFYGLTSTTGAGKTGVLGITADTIKMYDITPASPSTIYDIQTGTVYPNAIYDAWGIPDSLRAYFVGCSVEISLEIPLAINWNYFFANLVNEIPLLTWSAELDRNTIFEIQRSYDGTNFYGIKEIPSETGRSEYDFSDKLVNARSPVVYYRIKATQLSGEEKYTQVRTVKFNSKQENKLFTAPNPFNNNFIINYQSPEKEMITIRMFNMSGQQQLTKQVPVNNGVNIIKITEAAQLSTGIYIIQVSNGSKMISSGKIIKQ